MHSAYKGAILFTQELVENHHQCFCDDRLFTVVWYAHALLGSLAWTASHMHYSAGLGQIMVKYIQWSVKLCFQKIKNIMPENITSMNATEVYKYEIKRNSILSPPSHFSYVCEIKLSDSALFQWWRECCSLGNLLSFEKLKKATEGGYLFLFEYTHRAARIKNPI